MASIYRCKTSEKQYKNLQKVQTNFYIDLILVVSLSLDSNALSGK